MHNNNENFTERDSTQAAFEGILLARANFRRGVRGGTRSEGEKRIKKKKTHTMCSGDEFFSLRTSDRGSSEGGGVIRARRA